MTYARSTQLAHTACVVVSLLFAACSPQRSDDGGEAVDVASGEPLASADALASRDDRLFLPRRIHHTEGNVANPDGLLPGRAGTTTLTAAAGEPEPMIVLDYGRDVGGIPEFLIVAVTGTPRLQAIYSERLDDLRPAGDASYPDGHEVNVSYIGNAGGASLSRVNSFTVAGPGLVRTAMAQGGERYQAIRIAGAGTVTLARVGIRSTHTTVQAMRSGSFLSSDPALNEIWDLGATTVELTRFPAGTLPTTWTIGRDGLRVSGSSYSVYQAGTAWHDYTASFDLHVVRNEASWFVGEPAFGFQFTVAAHDDQLAAVDRALRDPDRVHGTDRNDRERRDSCRWRPGRASHQRPGRDRPARGGRRSGRVAPGVPLCPRARAGEVPGRDRALSRAPCPSLSSPRSPGPAAAPARPMRSASADRCSRRSAHP